MQCPGCKYPDSRVVHTYRDDDRVLTKRRHECQRCGKRFTTHEQKPNDDRFPREQHK